MDDESTDRRIARLAARQHGIVTRQQLFTLGLGKGAIHARTKGGRLHAVHAGVYLVGHTATAPLAREMAAVLACGEDAVISHRSAAPLWAFARVSATAQVEVTISGTRAPRRPGIHVYTTRSLAPEDLRLVDAIPVTSPARTLLDLSRFFTAESFEPTVADALRRGLVDPGELIGQVERNAGRPGVSTLRAVLGPVEPAFTRSVAERKLLRLIRAASLPSPLVNARVGSYEVDFLWPRERLIVEVDGFRWHADRDAFERDRERDAELLAMGYRVLRVTWRQLRRHPRSVVARIARVLHRAVDRSAHG